jgi:hypothetical protein
LFLTRNPTVFECVLDFYRTGKLLRSPAVSEEQLQEELRFFNIPADGGRPQLFMCGRGDLGQLGCGDRCSSAVPVAVEALDGVGVVQVSLGTAHVTALLCDGTVRTWGHGTSGRLGLGDEDDRLLPVQVPSLVGVSQVRGVSVCIPVLSPSLSLSLALYLSHAHTLSLSLALSLSLSLSL